MGKHDYIKEVKMIIVERKEARKKAKMYEKKAQNQFLNELRKLKSDKQEKRKHDLTRFEIWD